MTPYSFECEQHGQFELRFPMGEAPRTVECPYEDGDVVVFHDAHRVFGAVMKFTYGKQAFHGSTLGEQLEAQHKHWADEGRKVEYVGSRWV